MTSDLFCPPVLFTSHCNLYTSSFCFASPMIHITDTFADIYSCLSFLFVSRYNFFSFPPLLVLIYPSLSVSLFLLSYLSVLLCISLFLPSFFVYLYSAVCIFLFPFFIVHSHVLLFFSQFFSYSADFFFFLFFYNFLTFYFSFI